MTAVTTETPAPAAKRVPTERTHHGDTVVDEYAWLAAKDDPETIAHLTAENAYTEARTAHLEALRATAVRGDPPAHPGDRPVGARPARAGTGTTPAPSRASSTACTAAGPSATARPTPPISADGAPLDGEEMLLDGNLLAEGHDFFSLGAFDVSPDGRWLAYSTDFAGDERFTLRVKDLHHRRGAARRGARHLLRHRLVHRRLHAVLRHRRRGVAAATGSGGTPSAPRRAEDVVVHEEDDERFWVGVELTRSERFVLIDIHSKITSEVRVIPAGNPTGEPAVDRAAAAGRRVLGGAPRAPVPDPAQRRRRGLRAGVHLGGRARRLDAADRAHPRHPAGVGRRVREPPGRLAAPQRADRAAGAAGRRRRRVRHRLPRADLQRRAGRQPGVPHQRRSGCATPRWSPPTRSTTTTWSPGRWCCASRSRCCPGRTGGRTTRPTTSSTGTGRSPTTAPGCRSRWSAARAPHATAPPPPSSTATARTRRAWTRGSRSPGCPCSTGASSSRWRTSAAAASWAGAGTTRASCWPRRTPSPTSSPAPGTWSRRAGRPATGWSPGAPRPAAC